MLKRERWIWRDEEKGTDCPRVREIGRGRDEQIERHKVIQREIVGEIKRWAQKDREVEK